MKSRSICITLIAVLLTACGGGGETLFPDPIGAAPAPATAPTPPGSSSGGDTRDCSIRYSVTQSPVLTGADPKFGEQWHLLNTQPGGVDIRATQAWITTKGANSRVAVIDDAIEIVHQDLIDNVVAGASFNYFGSSTQPLPCLSTDDHGTQVAGIVAARDSNGIGVAGVAPQAKLVGFNALDSNTDEAVIDALTRDNQANQIYHNSWGSADDGFQHDAGAGWAGAIDRGIRSGRAGKGSIYVFSSGNGGTAKLANGVSHVDNSNFDGYVNRIGVIAACAVNDFGARPFFAELGANQLVCAPGYGANRGITTTAIQNSYSSDFIGTSASAPVVSGVVALMLSVNPNLTWRDVPIILAQTARKTSDSDTSWNGSGANRYSSYFGFGMVDAEKAVAVATTWTSVGDSSSLISCGLITRNPNLAIPDSTSDGISGTLVSDSLSVGGDCAIRKIEYIDVFITSDHPYPADLVIKLVSPSATTSQLTVNQSCGQNLSTAENPCKQKLDNWRFGVVRHLNETSQGTWRLEVGDYSPEDVGRINSWSIKIWGRP